jgi:hypothetical protein
MTLALLRDRLFQIADDLRRIRVPAEPRARLREIRAQRLIAVFVELKCLRFRVIVMTFCI